METTHLEADNLAPTHDWLHLFIGVEEPALDEEAIEGLKVVGNNKEILVLKPEQELAKLIGDVRSDHTI